MFKEDGTKAPGVIDNLNEFVSRALKFPDGILTTRTKGLDSKIDQIDRRINQKKRNTIDVGKCIFCSKGEDTRRVCGISK